MISQITSPLVSVVVVNHNGRQFLESCLVTVLKSDYPDFEVIVVDNGSTDDSVDVARERFGADPRVKVVLNERNLGFAGGSNTGARQAKGKFLVFLNNDTRVDPDWLEELVSSVLTDERIGIAVCRITTASEPSGTLVGNVDRYGNGVLVKIKEPVECTETIASGPAFLVTRVAWDTVGGFDPKYFIYSEDIDLAWRVRLAGYRVTLAYKSVVYHEEGQTTRRVGIERRRYLVYRNTLRTLLKNYSNSSLIRVLPVSLVLNLIEGLALAGVDGNPRVALSPIRAILWNLMNLRETIVLHDRIQENRVINDSDVQSLMAEFNPLTPCRAWRNSRNTSRGKRSELHDIAEVGDHIHPSLDLPLISVVVVNYNGGALLHDCIKSVLAGHYPKIEVILVDNASVDGSLGQIEDLVRFDRRLKIIRNSSNQGYAGGNNTGAARASGVYIVFLNLDTLVHHRWLEEVAKFMESRPDVGVAQCAIYSMDDPKTFDNIGHYIDTIGLAYFIGQHVEDIGQFNRSHEMFGAYGAALVARTELFRHLNGFDQDFFMLFEESDLCWRTWLAGLKVAFIPSAIVYHKGGSSYEKTRNYYLTTNTYYFVRNRLMALMKNYESKNLLKHVPTNLLFMIGLFVLKVRNRRSKEGLSVIRGLMWNLSNLRKILQKRAEVLRIRKVSDESLINAGIIRAFNMQRAIGKAREMEII